MNTDVPQLVSWLDQTVAVPTIGVKYRQNYQHIFDYPSVVLKTVTKDLGIGERHFFRQKNAYEFSIDLQNGYVVTVNQERMVFRFQYTTEERRTPGKLPSFEGVDELPYAHLLGETAKNASLIMESLATLHEIEFKWVGIVANVSLDKNVLPQGVSNFIKSLGSVWGKMPVEVDGRITIAVNDRDDYYDRCHHQTIFREEQSPDEVVLILDWQRVHRDFHAVPKTRIKQTLLEWAADAVAYFDKFGQGNLE